MMRVLRTEHALSDLFISHMLTRNVRIEEDLVGRLFNSSEKRLARALLLLARYGKEDEPHAVLHKVSQEMLAAMIGTTRSRVNFFMNKFRKLGFIEYNGGLSCLITRLNPRSRLRQFLLTHTLSFAILLSHSQCLTIQNAHILTVPLSRCRAAPPTPRAIGQGRQPGKGKGGPIESRPIVKSEFGRNSAIRATARK
jgi:Crp-like helix-turn-helix domain